jgi:hypothetical protein
MTGREPAHEEHGQPDEEHLAAIGQPAGETIPGEQPDFAGEHDDTAVAEEIVTDEGDREPESPHGWAGMED